MNLRISAILIMGAIFALRGSVAEEISVTVNPSQIQPGDLFSLKIAREAKSYAKFEVERPKMDSLRLIASELHPVRFSDDRYYQEVVYIFQANRSGNISFDEIQVRISSPSGDESITLAPAVLSVIPYTDASGNDPLSLSGVNASPNALRPYGWLLITAIALAMVGLLWGQWWRRKSRPSNPVVEDQLTQAIEELKSGIIPVERLQRLLETDDSRLGSAGREQIQRTLFGQHRDPMALADTLRKGAGQ